MSASQPRRILRIIHPLSISGPAFQALLLTSSLNQMGYESYLVTGQITDSPDTLHKILDTYAVEPLILPEFDYENPFAMLPALMRLVDIIREYQPDIVHTHNTRAGFLGRIAARIAGVPVTVHTMHEYPFRGYYNRLSTLLFIYMERIGAYYSDSIITLSESLRKALVDTYGITRKSRITVLPIGFDLDIFAQTKRKRGIFREEWLIAADAPLIGIIGRLLPVKNHALFLEAARQIHQALPDARFAIVGDGEERANLEALARQLGLSDAVIFTGWQQQMERIYSDLDVLVNSSWNEGTPVPIIEALAAACPVVGTAVGGIPDLLDRGTLGKLVPSGDADALSKAIMETLQSPPDMQQAQKTMLKRYSIERLAQDLDSLYRGLLAKKQHRKMRQIN
jgi:glycosyltransferase involved in cell wall biosynthesis